MNLVNDTIHRASASLHQQNKPFKSRHSTKGQTKGKEKRRLDARIAPKSSSMVSHICKVDRKNACKIKQRKKKDQWLQHHRTVGYISPKLIAIVCLSRSPIDSCILLKKLYRQCGVDFDQEMIHQSHSPFGYPVLNVQRFQQKFCFLLPDPQNIFHVLDATRVADYVLFVVSARDYLTSPSGESGRMNDDTVSLFTCATASSMSKWFHLSEHCDMVLRCIRAQGMPSPLLVLDGLGNGKGSDTMDLSLELPVPTLRSKKRHEWVQRLTHLMSGYLQVEGNDSKKHDYQRVFQIECRDLANNDNALEESEVNKLLRYLACHTPRTLHFREQHGYLLVNEVEFVESSAKREDSDHIDLSPIVRMSGYVRGGRPMNIQRRMYIPGYGLCHARCVSQQPEPYVSGKIQKDRLCTMKMDIQEKILESVDWDTILREEYATKEIPRDDAVERQNLITEESHCPIIEEDMGELLDDDMDDAEMASPTEDMESMTRKSNVYNSTNISASSKTFASVSTSPHRTKRVPKGTSEYQTAWYFSDTDEDNVDETAQSTLEENKQICMNASQKGLQSSECYEIVQTESRDTYLENRYDKEFDNDSNEDWHSDLITDIPPSSSLCTLKELIKQAQEDLQFPDESDTPRSLPARVRFQKYRGLKNWRFSTWDMYENLPVEYEHIVHFANYRHSAKVAHNNYHGVCSGNYVTLELMNVPQRFIDDLHAWNANWHHQLKEAQILPVSTNEAVIRSSCLSSMIMHRPFWILVNLVQHEHKVSLLNALVTRCSYAQTSSLDYVDPPDCSAPYYSLPVRSKDVVHVRHGFRQFHTSAIYSDHSKGDRHKYERFFHFHRPMVATFYGPVAYPPTPLLMFTRMDPTLVDQFVGHDAKSMRVKDWSDVYIDKTAIDASISESSRSRIVSPLTDSSQYYLLATGHFMNIQPHRMVIKRVTLTGYPFKIHKRSAVIRQMFHNPSDICWFQPIRLATKYGRIGHIREPLGTHGHMKCQFDGPLNAQDTVCMYLYKRVYPRWSTWLTENDWEETYELEAEAKRVRRNCLGEGLDEIEQIERMRSME